jgi:hypothetical protein
MGFTMFLSSFIKNPLESSSESDYVALVSTIAGIDGVVLKTLKDLVNQEATSGQSELIAKIDSVLQGGSSHRPII